MKYNLKEGFFTDVEEPGLISLLIRRLENFFIITDEEAALIREYHSKVIDKMNVCFRGIDNKYFNSNGEALFSSSHSGQYLIYLYFYSNIFAKEGNSLKDKFYYLNKILHSVDIYAEVNLPPIFFFEHPLGMVLGRAKYGNNFFAMQGCTVGGNKGHYPIIGDNVRMFSNSKILGRSKIGDNVWLSANSYVKDEDIPNNMIVFGQSPNLVLKENNNI